MILGQALTYKTNKFIKINNGIRASVSYDTAIHIGVVFNNESPEMTKQVEHLESLLKEDGKQVKVLAYERDVQVKHLPFPSFTKKDVSFWGNFTNQSIQSFSDISFDFLICLNSNPGVIIQNLLAKSKAKCRVGICNDFENYNKLFELIVQNSPQSNVVDGVYAYLKNIR